MSDPIEFEEEAMILEKAFETAWGNSTPVRWRNTAWQEPTPNADDDPCPWVSLSFITGEGRQISLNTQALVRYTGVVIVQLFQKENTGDREVRRLGAQAAAAYRKKQILLPSGGHLDFGIPFATQVGQMHGWWQMNMNCPYQRNAFHS